MSVPAEVGRLKKRLDDTFLRAKALTDAELLSDSAKYLCVLVSGYLEQSIVEILLEHVRRSSGPTVRKHMETELRRRTNFKAGKIIALFGSFSSVWEADLKAFITDEKRAAVDSVVDLRHTIAHGRHTGLTMISVRAYYSQIELVVKHLAALS
jgi:hypothetical protein